MVRLLAIVVLFAGCWPGTQSEPKRTLPEDPETIPDEVLDESDPHVDTSKHPSVSQGGCGGLFNPCPDINRPAGGCMGCPPAVGDRGAFPAPAAAPFLLLLLWIRRPSTGSGRTERRVSLLRTVRSRICSRTRRRKLRLPVDDSFGEN